MKHLTLVTVSLFLMASLLAGCVVPTPVAVEEAMPEAAEEEAAAPEPQEPVELLACFCVGVKGSPLAVFPIARGFGDKHDGGGEGAVPPDDIRAGPGQGATGAGRVGWGSSSIHGLPLLRSIVTIVSLWQAPWHNRTISTMANPRPFPSPVLSQPNDSE